MRRHNQFQIVKDLMIKNVGSAFTRAISNMYHSTYYVPKITTQRTGHPILAKHGVTQGRKSSTNLFSFAICDMPKVVAVSGSFLCGNNVLQLADDASLITNSFKDLSVAFKQIIQTSCETFMVTNIEKTFYLLLSKKPVRLPIYPPDNQTIHHVDNDEHLYLGMLLTTSNDTMPEYKAQSET